MTPDGLNWNDLDAIYFVKTYYHVALFASDARREGGGISLAWEYSFVQRLFALCNISTRLTKKGMRANDTQFLLIFLDMLMMPVLFFYFADCCSC